MLSNGKWAILTICTVCLSIAAGCGGTTEPGSDVVDDSGLDARADTGLNDTGDDSGADARSDDGSHVDSVEEAVDSLVDGDGSVDPGPASVTVGEGDFTAVVDTIDKSVTLTVDGQTKFVLNGKDIQIGTVKAIDPTLTYDPYAMLARDPAFTEPAGLVWNQMTGIRLVSVEDSVASFDVIFGEGEKSFHADMTVKPSNDGRFRVFLKPAETVKTAVYYRISPDVTETENFYGLGAYLDQVAHRGKVRAMQLEPALDLESGYNEAHVPVPFVISTAGWGILVENIYPAAFDCAAWDPKKMDIVFGTGESTPEGLIFHLYAARHPMDLTQNYYKDTGDALLPARWGLGPVFWKDEVSGQAEVESDLDHLRDLDLATTAYWIDRPYASGVNAFDFHPVNYPNPQAMIDKAHDMGFRMMLWHTPYISDGDNERSDTTDQLNQFAKENGYFVKDALPFNKWSSPIDFTNPDAYAWFQGLIRQYTDMGIEGFKLDYGEDIVIGAYGLDVSTVSFFDGSTERTMHARYQNLYHQVYAETLPEDGSFLICRAGRLGDQVNVSVIWPGDLDANMAYHRETILNDDGNEILAVGGLPASVIYGLSLGASGFPFFGSDTGGYRNSPPNKETYVRWMQQTAVSSVMQVGNDSNSIPWDPESGIGFDDQVLELYREFARLHLRLWPYEWTYAKNIAVTGHPITRPIGLMYPQLGVHPDDQYMFGDYLLAAPVMRPGLVERDVIFPAGDWIDWFTGEIIEGGRTVKVQAPLEKLPLYLARSGIVPLLRPTIDAIAPVSEEYSMVDTYHNRPGVLYPVVFPGPESSFTLFDGAVITQTMPGNGTVEATWTDGSEFNHGALFTFVGLDFVPSGVTLDGESLSIATDLNELEMLDSGWLVVQGRLHVRVPSGTHSIKIM